MFWNDPNLYGFTFPHREFAPPQTPFGMMPPTGFPPNTQKFMPQAPAPIQPYNYPPTSFAPYLPPTAFNPYIAQAPTPFNPFVPQMPTQFNPFVPQVPTAFNPYVAQVPTPFNPYVAQMPTQFNPFVPQVPTAFNPYIASTVWNPYVHPYALSVPPIYDRFRTFGF